jgi:hypothetical protein
MNNGRKLVVVAFYFSFVVVTSFQIETKKTKEKRQHPYCHLLLKQKKKKT